MQRRLSRRSIFHRDGYKCQYCGLETRTLTLDHIIPRSKGGAHSWQNVVSACIPCNHRKAGLLPSDAKMKLARQPGVPRPDPYALFHHRAIPGRVAPVHTLGRLADHRSRRSSHYDEGLRGSPEVRVEHLGRRDRHLRLARPIGRLDDDPFSDLQLALAPRRSTACGPVSRT